MLAKRATRRVLRNKEQAFPDQILCFAANASTCPVSQILQISRDHEYQRNYMNRMDHPNACYMDDFQEVLDVYYMTFKAQTCLQNDINR